MVGSNVERNRNVKVKKKSPSKESITLIKSQVKTMVKKGSVNKQIYIKILTKTFGTKMVECGKIFNFFPTLSFLNWKIVFSYRFLS